jgi:hypothetical protein
VTTSIVVVGKYFYHAWQKPQGPSKEQSIFEIFLQAQNGLEQRMGMIKRIGKNVKSIDPSHFIHMETGILSQEIEVARNPSCIVMTAVLRVRK